MCNGWMLDLLCTEISILPIFLRLRDLDSRNEIVVLRFVARAQERLTSLPHRTECMYLTRIRLTPGKALVSHNQGALNTCGLY